MCTPFLEAHGPAPHGLACPVYYSPPSAIGFRSVYIPTHPIPSVARVRVFVELAVHLSANPSHATFRRRPSDPFEGPDKFHERVERDIKVRRRKGGREGGAGQGAQRMGD